MTREEAREIWDYDPSNGEFVWKISPNRSIAIGDGAGTLTDRGYWRVLFKGKQYYIHRVAWLIYHGDWPENQIDHIDHDRGNNRISNLRDVTRQENHMNQSKQSNNTSGIMGVYWHKKKQKWGSSITVKGKRYFLGDFNHLEDAIGVRKAAEIKFGFHCNHGK